jgi:hypothetical protein
MVVASCRNKYYGTNFISAVHTSLLIVPGLRTIQFLFFLAIKTPETPKKTKKTKNSKNN